MDSSLELVEDGEHVDELAEREEVGLGDKVLALLLVRQALHLRAEALDGLPLERVMEYLYRVSQQVSDLGWLTLFWVIRCLPDSAGADERWAVTERHSS